MAARIQVTIIRSTAKAHLVADATGRQGWIQQRWLKNGTVSAETFEKAVESAADRQQIRQSQQEADAAEREFERAAHRVAVVKETDKAVAAEVILRIPGGFEEPALVWFPKSAIGGGDGVAEVPGWMIREREQKVVSEWSPRGQGSYVRHRFCKGEPVELVRGVQIVEAALVAAEVNA